MLLKEMSDEDLIFLINAGSKYAERVFYSRYDQHSHKLAKDFQHEFNDSGISEEEFHAIAFEKVYHALQNYTNIEKPFHSFWIAIAKNAIYDYVRINSYQLGARSFADISLDDVPYHENDRMSFHDVIGIEDIDSPIIRTVKELIYGDSNVLTEQEKCVADLLYFQNYKVVDIVNETKLNRNQINYLIRNARQKIQKILKEDYL